MQTDTTINKTNEPSDKETEEYIESRLRLTMFLNHAISDPKNKKRYLPQIPNDVKKILEETNSNSSSLRGITFSRKYIRFKKIIMIEPTMTIFLDCEKTLKDENILYFDVFYKDFSLPKIDFYLKSEEDRTTMYNWIIETLNLEKHMATDYTPTQMDEMGYYTFPKYRITSFFSYINQEISLFIERSLISIRNKIIYLLNIVLS